MNHRIMGAYMLAGLVLAGCGGDDGTTGSGGAGGAGGAGGETSSSTQGTGGGTTSGGGQGGMGQGGAGTGGQGGSASMCTAALEQALGPIDTVSTGDVIVLATNGSTKTLYIDASAGGSQNQKTNPWIYLNLASTTKVQVTDKSAYGSTDWDLALKRPLIRTNSGDGGPGQGGAVFLDGAMFANVTSTDATGLLTEDWFDATCTLQTDPTGAIATTFAPWYDYDQATHALSPHPGVFVVRGGDGALYKLQILDYYATPQGGTGMTGGRYRIDVAPLSP